MFHVYCSAATRQSKNSSGQVAEPRVRTKHDEAAFSGYAAHKCKNLPREVK